MNHRKTNEGLEERLPGLIAAARTGDQQAFTALYEATKQEVYRTARAVLQSEQMALDIQQDTFVYAFTHLDKLEDPAKLRPWLRAIAVNMARTALRKQTPVLFTELETEEGSGLPEQADPSPEASPEMSLDRKETAALVNEILDGLSAGQRAAVGMYYYEQMSVNEIAEALGVNAGTVKTQIARGRKKIEEAVRGLEKRGIKLYGLSPLPFLVALMKRQSPAEEAGRAALAQTLEKAGISAGAKAVAAAAGSGGAASGAGAVAVHLGRGFFETVAGRLILGVIVAGVIGGGAFGYRWLNEHRSQKQDPTLPTDEEQLLVIPTAPTAPEERVSDVRGSDLDTEEDLVTEPGPTEPPTEPTEPEPTEPEPSEPQPTDPKPADPKPSDPQPSEPQPSEPQPTDPEPTDPQPTDPEPSELPTENEDLDVGGCGADLIWTYDKTSGVLTITGSGEMLDYGDSRIPWQPYRETLTEVVFPSGLTHVGAGAFRDCTTLKSVVLPDGVEQLSSGVFSGCTGLERVVLPARMTKIGDRAFLGCSSLEELPLPNGLTQIGDNAFQDCAALSRVILPDNLTELGREIFSDCRALTEVVLPKNLSRLPNGMFRHCCSLSQLAFPAGLTAIGDGAFNDCVELQLVDLPEGLRAIGDRAFWNCYGLKSLALPAGLERIGASAFYDCHNLTSVSLPNGLVSIGADAFLRCSALTSVEIPSNVTAIGAHALGYTVRFLDDGTEEYVKLSDFTIYGAAGSAAQAYAEENGFPFITK